MVPPLHQRWRGLKKDNKYNLLLKEEKEDHPELVEGWWMR